MEQIVAMDGEPEVGIPQAPAGIGPIHRAPPRLRDHEFVNIDRLRLLAVADIVGFHVMNPFHPLGGIGLPAFLMFTVALNTRRTAPEPFGRMVTRKLPWFLAPWLSWSAVYGAILTISALHHHRPAFSWFSTTMLATGTYYHLWYLPYAFLAVCGANLIHHSTVRLQNSILIAGCVLASVALLLIEHGHGSRLPPEARAWLFSVAAFPLGIALGRCLSIREEQERWMHLLLLACLMVGACIPLGIELHDPTVRRYSLTIVLACAVTAYSGPPDPVTRLLTSWRFGIYLVHPLVIREYEAFLGGWGGPWVETSVVLVASALLVGLLQATPLRRMVPAALEGRTAPAPWAVRPSPVIRPVPSK
jgi:surface polysaccharide O-acyltransferase-like enzyme